MEHASSNLFTSTLPFFLLIVFPFLAALCVYQVRSLPMQSFIVTASGTLLAAGALLLVRRVPLSLTLPLVLGVDPNGILSCADLLLLCAILYLGFRLHDPVIKVLAVMQISLLAILQFFIKNGKNPAEIFYVDDLALMLILVASTAITLSTMRLSFIPCLRALEEEPSLKQSSRHRFFALLLVCLGALDGMVLSNDMSFFYFFFELITLGSFLLIAQKGTPGAAKKAVQTLSLTSLAGFIFLLAMA
jgi:ech hydrogenase subunit A